MLTIHGLGHSVVWHWPCRQGAAFGVCEVYHTQIHQCTNVVVLNCVCVFMYFIKCFVLEVKAITV